MADLQITSWNVQNVPAGNATTNPSEKSGVISDAEIPVVASADIPAGAGTIIGKTIIEPNGELVNATVNKSQITNQDVFGDGSDGDVTISSDTTLSSDMFYNNLTISTTGALTDQIPSVDGYAYRTSANSVFSTIRTSATGTGSDGAGGSVLVQLDSGTTTDRYDTISRGILVFDTSSIPDGATITSATLRLYVSAKTDNMSQSISIVTRTDPTTIDNTDYNIANWTMTKQATDLTVASLTTSAYNTWTLNATGLSNISKTGSTILGVVTSADADNSAPTWSSNVRADITFDSSRGTNKPKLTVNYTYTPRLDTGGYRIFCKGTLTIEAGCYLSRNGNNGTAGGNGTNGSGSTEGSAGGTAGSGGTAPASGSVYGGTVGAAGVAGQNGHGGTGVASDSSTAGTAANNGSNVTKSIGSTGSAGQTGADSGRFVNAGAAASGGAAGSAGSKSGTVYNTPKNAIAAYLLLDGLPSPDILRCSTPGGGNGGSAVGCGQANTVGDTYSGGGGGGGGGNGSTGGIVVVFAKKIVNNGTIEAKGGAGGNGGNAGTCVVSGSGTLLGIGGSGGGCGGNGGTGGVLILTYSSLSGSGTTSVSGGTGGTKGTGSAGAIGGSSGSSVTSGSDGKDGISGASGVSYTLVI